MVVKFFDWRDDLVSQNAVLFQLRFAGQTYTPGRPEVGDGWRALVENAVQGIRRVAVNRLVKVTGIKSFSGSVRITWVAGSRLPAKVDVGIRLVADLATARSCCRCEICGKDGALWRCGVRLATACDEHGVGFPEALSPGGNNLHLKLGFEEGFPAPIRYRRFSPHKDALVDIDPAQIWQLADAESRPVVARPPTDGSPQDSIRPAVRHHDDPR